MRQWLVLLLICGSYAVKSEFVELVDDGSDEVGETSPVFTTADGSSQQPDIQTSPIGTSATSSPSDVTTNTSPDGSGTSTVSGSTDYVSPQSSQSTITPEQVTTTTADPNQTTQTAGPPVTGETTQKQTTHEGDSTATAPVNPGATTTVAPQETTLYVTTEAPTTTLPPVNVSHVDFTHQCGQDGFCVYTFYAPVNSPSFLASEQSIIDNDDSDLKTVKGTIDTYKASVNAATADAQTKLQALRAKLNAAQAALNKIQTQVQGIQDNLRVAQNNLTTANIYLDTLRGQRDSCYYQACLTPPTLPPPTRPPTTPPATTPSPCEGIVCGDENVFGPCKVDNNGPYCTACPGNLDGHLFCQTSVCSSNGAALAGNFFSPGFFTKDNHTAYPSSSVCTWTLTGKKLQIPAGALDVSNLDASSELKIFYGDGQTFTIYNTTKIRNLNFVFAEADQFTIRLTTTNTVPDGAYFNWYTESTSGAELMEEPEDQYLGKL